MGKLVVSLDGVVIKEVQITKDKTTLGRRPYNDIVIDNLAVSGEHAVLQMVGSDVFIEDLNSTNGTYVNGKLIKKHALQHGDVITVGHHALRFVDGEAEEPQDEFEKTMVIGPRAAARLQIPAAATAPSPPPLTPPAAQQGFAPPPAPKKAKLQVLSGQFAGRELELVKTLTTLGRPGVQVAAITRRADGYYIVNVESPDGNLPQVNGVPIGPQARKLHDNDVLQLAGVKMGFFEN